MVQGQSVRHTTGRRCLGHTMLGSPCRQVLAVQRTRIAARGVGQPTLCVGPGTHEGVALDASVRMNLGSRPPSRGTDHVADEFESVRDVLVVSARERDKDVDSTRRMVRSVRLSLQSR